MPEQPNFFWKLVNLDPALLRGLIMAVVVMLGSAGILVSDSLPDQLVALWVSVSAVIQALWTKSAVTANARVVVSVPDPVNAPNVVAPGAAVTDAPPADIIEAARTSGS